MFLKFTIQVFVFLFLLLASIRLHAGNIEWNSLSKSSATNPVHVQLDVLNSTANETVLKFRMDAFSDTKVQTPDGEASILSSDKLSRILEAGSPDVGKLSFSLSIPDNAEMEVQITGSSYLLFENRLVAPSKGNLYRNTNPSQVPYTWGSSYSQNEFFPGSLVELQEPYILRDVRGQAVWIYPFQYNPVTRQLKVYSEIQFRIMSAGSSNINALTRTSLPSVIDPVYHNIYKSHFINPPSVLYTPLAESGNMLVICYDQFLAAMQPFVNWKNKMGQHTEMVAVSTVGSASSDLKNYIVDYYNTNGLTFVLLVGDAAEVPVPVTSYGDSDPSYGYILGNDSYAEVIVGRFSAETVEDVNTMVQRTLNYEMSPDPLAQWYQKGVCIGSDQGPGDDNELDYEHQRNMRTDEMAYTYAVADELYDGSQGLMDSPGDPGPHDLATSLNDGRGVITYTGHGSNNAFSTTGFSSSDVVSLTNVDMLPFIWSVACVNGNFNGITCLAESFLRATDLNGAPTGAVATLMATINQSWDPPMDAQDEFVDLLTEQYPVNVKHTFGGLSVNGCMHMNDVYGTAGDEMTDTWTCFGDPSLMVRTTSPMPMTVSHDPLIDETVSSLILNCNTDGALVCLSRNNEIITTGNALLGICGLSGISGIVSGDILDVTVTAYNKLPYFGTINVTSITNIFSFHTPVHSLSVFPTLVNDGLLSVEYSLSVNANVKLTLTDAAGREVIALTDSYMKSGNYKIPVDLSSKGSGVYFINLTANGLTDCRKLILR